MNDDIKENSEIVEKKSKGFWREIFETAVIVIVILLPVRFFIAQPFVVVGSSMSPTFLSGDYLIVDEISYRFEDPKRGDVIVFRPPVNEKDHYIKRIVGLPSETISVVDNTVTIKNKDFPKGFVLEENYVSSERSVSKELTLGPDEYFVMGDNRSVSSDSRIWGALKKDEITGRALFRLYPLNSIDYFPGKIEEAK